MVGSFCHTIHLFIHPSICSTTPLPSFIHFLTGISISFHFNSFLTVLKSIPLYCYLIISSMISPLISASSEWMDSYYPSIHLDYCMHSSICPEPQINWARKKKEKKKGNHCLENLKFRAESFALSPEALPTSAALSRYSLYMTTQLCSLQTHKIFLEHPAANFTPMKRSRRTLSGHSCDVTYQPTVVQRLHSRIVILCHLM